MKFKKKKKNRDCSGFIVNTRAVQDEINTESTVEALDIR
jgi:hypothetical protein